MKSAKNIFLLTCLLVITLLSLASAQTEISYQNISYTPEMAKEEVNNAVQNLINLSYGDPYDPNRYHMLGYIYYQSYRDYDILKDYKGATTFADSAFFYFQKARDLLTPKDLKKYGDYYVKFLNYKNPSNLVQEAQYAFIRTDLDAMIAESFKFKEQASGIYTYFNRSLENYKRANTIYIEICERFETKEDLLLLADQQFYDDIGFLVTSYDSTTAYFTNYKAALKNFPIKKYNQEYTVKPITQYILEGQKRANFFDTKFEIWDYKKWQREIKTEIKDKISIWRERIQIYEDRLNADLAKISAMESVQEKEFKVEDTIIKTINEYEKNSALEYIFTYKVGKLNLFNQLSFKADSNATFTDIATHTIEVMSGVKECRTLLADIGKGTAKSLARHRDFFKQNYPDGLPNFLASESLFLDSRIGVLNRQLELEINKAALNWKYNPSDSLVYQKKTLKLSPEKNATDISLNVTQEGKMVTLAREVSKSGLTYLSGFVKEAGKHKAFVAATRQDSVLWMNFPIVNARELRGDVLTEAPTLHLSEEEGLLVGVYSFVESEKGFGHTTLLHYDSTGQAIKTVEVPKDGTNMGFYPRLATHNPKEGYQLVLKGYGSPTLANFSLEKAHLVMLNTTGEKTWEKEISIQGEIVALRFYQENILLLSNFKDLRLGPGENLNAEVESSSMTAYNIALSVLDQEGVTVQTRYIPTEEPIFAKELITVEGGHGGVAIIGLKGEPTDLEQVDKKNKAVIIVFDNELQPISENFE